MKETQTKKTHDLKIEWHASIAGIDRQQWNRLSRDLPTPLLEWEWLNEMERSGSIVPSQGWQPAHLTLRDPQGQLVAAAPLYIKSHSNGEYVFDQIWAQAAQQLNIDYYPKLIGMSPVTPVSGYRFLINPAWPSKQITDLMLQAIDGFCRANGLNSVHLLFVDPDWADQQHCEGYHTWQHQGFVLENKAYASFDDFLTGFNANQRKNIKKERRSMRRAGISFEILDGQDIPHTYFEQMYRFYENTNDQFGQWSCKYLTPDFFSGLADAFRHRLALVAAHTSGPSRTPVAMALFLQKKGQLWGRYWGAEAFIKNLHFNACYYEPTQWLIENGYRSFDPGLGGYHKVRRGFRAVTTRSLHRFFNPLMDHLFVQNIDKFNTAIQHEIAALNEFAPFGQ